LGALWKLYHAKQAIKYEEQRAKVLGAYCK